MKADSEIQCVLQSPAAASSYGMTSAMMIMATMMMVHMQSESSAFTVPQSLSRKTLALRKPHNDVKIELQRVFMLHYDEALKWD